MVESKKADFFMSQNYIKSKKTIDSNQVINLKLKKSCTLEMGSDFYQMD